MSDEIYEICPGIWFGPYDYTFTEDCIQKMTHIINLDTLESSTSARARTLCKFRHFPSYDHDNFPILKMYLEDVKTFIEDASNVYIHCYMGSNRSAIIACAIALERTSDSFNNLLNRLRTEIKTRPILTTDGFVEQLILFEEELLTSRSKTSLTSYSVRE